MKPVYLTALLITCLSLKALHAQQKGAASGQQLFATNCSACHGADGRGGERAPNIATTRRVVALTDNDLESTVKNGLPSVGMPSFGFLGAEKISNVVAYLRVLQGKNIVVSVPGDAAAGRTLFYGKADCAKCHMMHGEGGFLASDLSTYGSNVKPEQARHAIVDPGSSLEPTAKAIELETRTGQHISGSLRQEDNFNIAIQTPDGRFHLYKKAELARILHTSTPIMPVDYGAKLTQKELDDIVSYLITTASPSAQHARRRSSDADE
ncbi:c-type cytochrome [Edaphobacter flagellatus]|uniref:c-type cytochrome n=1 Tax=Edaphobacter flagellatus TaxID=1933044 RepID=UPI0021B20074|nr:c-type cytochrome [Edaphobacter flagellatus]